MMKKCSGCKRELPLTNFSKNKNNRDGFAYYCKDCAHEQYAMRYQKTRIKAYPDRAKFDRERNTKARDFLFSLKSPCAKCGETRPHIIQFHHINPDDKKHDMARIKKYPKDVVIEEIEKCVCLCANCHFEYHFFYGNRPKDPVESLEEYLNLNFNKENNDV